MKNKKFLLIPALALLLGACSGNNNGSNNNNNSNSSGGDSDYKPLLMNFYLDYNHYDEDNPYYSARWYYDTTFTKDQIGLSDPGSDKTPDPYYPTFKGWSLYAVVDEDKYLFNFGTDKIAIEQTVNGVIEFFGIYVGD